MSEVFAIEPAGELHGSVTIGGAKNSALKLIAASLLADGVTTLRNVPAIDDIATMLELVETMGANVSRDASGVVIDTSPGIEPVAPYELVRRMRASVVVLGPLLARFGQARIAMPGGCNLGARPIDLHLKGLEEMGVDFTSSHGYLDARTDRLRGSNVTLEFPSVGATENIVMAAVGADGPTVLENAAREPEITDLVTMLNRMGAHITGVGTSTLRIEPAEKFGAVEHEVVADRIEAGTFIAATGIAGGEVELIGARFDDLAIAISKFCDAGLLVSATADGIWVKSAERLRPTDIATLPFPGFATDLQPQAVALLSTSSGTSVVTENLFDGRFMYTEELVRMGADIRTDGRHAVVRGVDRLEGAPVTAPDLRAGAALVIAGLVADGETVVSGVEHIDRGYDDLVGKLRALGASIERRPA